MSLTSYTILISNKRNLLEISNKGDMYVCMYVCMYVGCIFCVTLRVCHSCGLRKEEGESEKGPNNASAATTTQSRRPSSSSSSSCKSSFPFSSLAFSFNLLSSSAIPSQVLAPHYSEFLFFLRCRFLLLQCI